MDKLLPRGTIVQVPFSPLLEFQSKCERANNKRGDAFYFFQGTEADRGTARNDFTQTRICARRLETNL